MLEWLGGTESARIDDVMYTRTSKEVNSDMIFFGTKFNDAHKNYAFTIMVRSG